jgi:hypothetical protein
VPGSIRTGNSLKNEWFMYVREAATLSAWQPDSEKSPAHLVKNVRYLAKCVNETKKSNLPATGP